MSITFHSTYFQQFVEFFGSSLVQLEDLNVLFFNSGNEEFRSSKIKEEKTVTNVKQKITASGNSLTHRYRFIVLGPIVQKADNAIHQINRFPADKC